MNNEIKTEDILIAANLLKGVAKRTPTELNHSFSERYNSSIYLKREDLQVVRSYKLRGAFNKISSLSPEEQTKGIVCASAGNHAQGVAYSCNKLGIKGTIFMPSTTPKQKVNQVKMFGKDLIEIVLRGDTFDDSNNEAIQFCKENNATYVHPFNDKKVIEGQGTVAIEVFEDTPEKLDYVIVPIGGGGISAGIISYFSKISPQTKIIGVEPEGAPSMKTSIEQGKIVRLEKIDKFIDGAAVQQVGTLNFEICKTGLEKVITIPEGKVCSTIIQLYNEEAIVVEPAGALTISALDYLSEEIKNKSVACIVSGSNNDIGRMQEIKERSLLYEGLKHYFLVEFPQRPGALKEFVDDVLGPNDDITLFEYAKKNIKESGPALVGIELKNKQDYSDLINRMEKKDFKFESVNENKTLFEYLIL